LSGLPAPTGAAVTAPVTAAALPALEVLAPQGEALRSTRSVVHLLGRTSAGSVVRINGERVPVFGSGVFARDGLALAMGANRFVVEATSAAGASTSMALTVTRVDPPPGPRWPVDAGWIDGSSLQPAEAMRVAPGEPVEVALRATPGRLVQAALPGGAWQRLAEVALGRYRGFLAFERADDIEPAPVRVRLLPVAAPGSRPRSARPAARPLVALTPGLVGQWRPDATRLFAVGPEGVEPTHGLHEVRLGGPSWGALPAGTLLQASGERGAHLRLALTPDTAVWAPRAALLPAAAGTPPPQVALSTVSVAGEDDADLVRVALGAPVPYAVRARRDATGRMALEIDICGAHHAATWVTHRRAPRSVDELVVEQAGPGRVRITAWLRTPRLWGWRVEPAPGALQVRLLPVPPSVGTATPLQGLRIALEAGHGGPTNLGAVGATGTPEKDFNRWTTDTLATELLAAGAQLVDIRPGDTNPTLRERAARAETEAAQLYVSVHANAADTAGGYLRVSGASTYYKHAPSQPLAAAVHRRLLAATALPDFGLVGNFNYAPLRLLTAMPSVLVEQAFVSHPGDEAQLLDPAFRARLAQAVRLGIEDALRG
jgi:N-acetylmuramoyl-L-alanine amidase